MESIFIGVDLGGTFVRVGAFTLDGELLGTNQAPIHAGQGPEIGILRIRSLIDETFAQAKILNQEYSLTGIGIGCTGPVDPTNGVINNPYTLPTWEHVPIIEPLETQFGVPVTLENDADAAALGEYWKGAGQGVQRLYAVTVGTGIGAAFIYNGQIYRGVGGAHPEGGHMLIDPTGPACYCGISGCWEGLASGPAIARLAKERIVEFPGSKILEKPNDDIEQIDARMVAQAADEGDELALAVMQKAAHDFSLGLANIVILFIPDMIVLSGGVMQSYKMFQPAVQQVLKNIECMAPVSQVQIVPAQLGYRAGIYGAAYTVIQKVKGEHV